VSRPADPKLIGAFVLGALALILAAVVVLGGGAFFRKSTSIVMFFEGSVSGLSVGSSVAFRGVKVGQVTQVFIRYSPDGAKPVLIPVFADISSENVQFVAANSGGQPVRRGTDQTLEELVERGLRGQLALPSLVTGQAAISLDFFPATPVEFYNVYPDRVEIPTVPSTLQEVQATLQQVYKKISELPLEELISDARNIIKGANTLVNDPRLKEMIGNADAALTDFRETSRTLDAQIGPVLGDLRATVQRADQTLGTLQTTLRSLDKHAVAALDDTARTMQAARQSLQEAERVLQSANEVVAPGSAMQLQLLTTLREVGTAARSLRQLGDELQRNPNALIFGRPATDAR